jgi:MarR family transcriptional regulator for hemolysin
MPTDITQARKSFAAEAALMARLWRRTIDRRLQPLGLTEATWLPLLHLSRGTVPMRQKDLAQSLALDSSSVVRLLDALETAGLTERAEGADRRAKTIALTEPGRAVVALVEAEVEAARQRYFGSIPDSDLMTAYAVVHQLTAVLARDLEAEA